MLRRSLTYRVLDFPSLSWSSLERAFPGRVHTPVAATDSPLFQISPDLRAIGLLPVRTVVASKGPSLARWVPFLIDTGLRQTFFADRTIKALALDVADRIEVFSARVNLANARSSQRYDGDVNILGADFLCHCELRINYPAGVIELDVMNFASPLEFIVTDGKVWFPVTPSKPTVMHLKDAIKAKLESNGLGPINVLAIVIKNPADGRKMGDEDRLQPYVEYVFEVPKE